VGDGSEAGPEDAPLLVINSRRAIRRLLWQPNELGLARGKQLYADAECLACHGERGRGDGPSAPTLRDNRDLPIAATDLTRPQRFKTGSRPEDIYRTLMTGLAGTPMPSYGDSLEPDQAWDLAYYVLSLSNNRRRTSEAVR